MNHYCFADRPYSNATWKKLELDMMKPPSYLRARLSAGLGDS